MKKFFGFLLTLAALLLLGCAALAADEVPSGIMDKLIPYTSDQGYWLQSFDLISAGDWAAATLQRNDGHNLLLLYRKRDNEWSTYLKSDGVIFQGRKQTSAYFIEDGLTYETHRDDISFSVSTPVLRIEQANSDQSQEVEYSERFIDFTLRNGTWLLTAWQDFDYCTVVVRDSALYYYGSWLAEYLPWRGKVTGTIQRDIRWASIGNIPHTYELALRSVTVAPDIPSGMLSAQEIRFTGGKKYSVYSGPGENYLRGGSGKAVVSTNDWIQVFGKENGWIMIQYAITADHMRIGWIRESALPKNADVGTLHLGSYTAHTAVPCALTDDPLFSLSSLMTVPAGAEVTWLTAMGSWTYVEYDTGAQPVRGFVRASDLTVMTEEQVKSAARAVLPAAEGSPASADTLRNYAVTCSYDTATGLWSVRFDSGKGDGYTVAVDDRTGAAWSVGWPNG